MEPEKSIEIKQEQLDSVSFQDDLTHTSKVPVQKGEYLIPARYLDVQSH